MPARGSHPNPLALPTGTRLAEYELEGVLGSGGFGITYRGRDVKLGLGVAIKEFLPVSLATRQGSRVVPQHSGVQETFRAALKDFVKEAQLLAAFQHQNIVRIIRYLEANGTAYLVMELLEGKTMSDWLRGLRRKPREQELRAILGPVMDGLEVMHRQDLLHRDIKPENIFLTRHGRPVLIDFGSARESLHASVPVASIISAGYSPFELYGTKTPAGAWTDIYSLGATFHTAVTGEPPPDATTREMKDTCELLGPAFSKHYSQGLLSAIDACLQVQPKQRPQNIAALRKILGAGQGQTRRGTPTFHGSRGLMVVTVICGLVSAGLVVWVFMQPAADVGPPSFEVDGVTVTEVGSSNGPGQPQGDGPASSPVLAPKKPASAELAALVKGELEAGNGSSVPAAKLKFYAPGGVSRDEVGGQPQKVSLAMLEVDLRDFFRKYKVRTFTTLNTWLESEDPVQDTAVIRQEYETRLVTAADDEVTQTRAVRLVTVQDASKSYRTISGWRLVSFGHWYRARLSVRDGAAGVTGGSEALLRHILRQDRLNYAAGSATRDPDDEGCPFFQDTDHLELLSKAALELLPGNGPASMASLCQGTPLVEVLVHDGTFEEDPAPKLTVRLLSP